MYPLLRGSFKRALSSRSTKPSPWDTNSSAVGHPTTQIFALTHTIAAAMRRSEEELKSMFERWMVEHEKSYSSLKEKEKRFKIFKEKLSYIEKENAKPNRTYLLGLNRFSDLTGEDFDKLYRPMKFNGMGMSYFTPHRGSG